MELNFLVFPAPKPSYSYQSMLGELIFIPSGNYAPPSALFDPLKSQSKKDKFKKRHIPCLFLPYTRGSTKLLLYFHGNAEDVGLAYDLGDHLKGALNIHVLIVEYPGYGIYRGKSSADQIRDDGLMVYDYFVNVIGWKEEDIIVFGRSIGTGPATELSVLRNPASLILMSAYTSLREVVKSLVGSMAGYIVKDRFRNSRIIPFVKCPTFLIHGQRDSLIPSTHSQKLHSLCTCPSSLLLAEEMDHNEFDFVIDLSNPVSLFLIQNQITTTPSPTKRSTIPLPPNIFQIPESFVQSGREGLIKKITKKIF